MDSFAAGHEELELRDEPGSGANSIGYRDCDGEVRLNGRRSIYGPSFISEFSTAETSSTILTQDHSSW